MNKMQKARELYKLHGGCRSAVVRSLVLDHDMTWAGARTYANAVAREAWQENYRRKHRWDFLKDPQTYLVPLLVIAMLLLSRIGA